MDFLPTNILEYAEKYTEKEPDILKELNRETHAKVLMPRMLAGHYQGRLISMFSHMIKPLKVLEIGTYTGYSAICWAEGLQKNGTVYTIDNNEELHEMVKLYIKKSGMENKIIPILGNAEHEINKLHETWDIVFIDADKENYINYYNQIFDDVRPGGYIIADNVLWSGKVTDSKLVEKDKETNALHSFNRMVQEDHRVENILLGIRDGLMIVRKK